MRSGKMAVAALQGIAAAFAAMGDRRMIATVFTPEHKNRPSWRQRNPKHHPHQGARECARRLRNIERHGAPG